VQVGTGIDCCPESQHSTTAHGWDLVAAFADLGGPQPQSPPRQQTPLPKTSPLQYLGTVHVMEEHLDFTNVNLDMHRKLYI